MNKAKQHTNRRDDWITPDSIFLPLEDLFRFTVDLAAQDHNRKCFNYFGPDHKVAKRKNFLTFIHNADCVKEFSNQTAWINPPYGRKNLPAFTAAIVELYDLHLPRFEIVALLPASIETNWFQDSVYGVANLYCRRGRIGFLDPKTFKPAKNGNTGPNILAHYPWQHNKCTEIYLREIGWHLLSGGVTYPRSPL